jgi:hypothetical protein
MLAVADGIVKLINHLEPEGSLDSKLERLLESELRRRLARYELVDKQLARKYGRSFDAFRDDQVIEQMGYSFEVESDFWDWEMAKDGIATVHDMLNELKGMASDR